MNVARALLSGIVLSLLLPIFGSAVAEEGPEGTMANTNGGDETEVSTGGSDGGEVRERRGDGGMAAIVIILACSVGIIAAGVIVLVRYR